MIRPLGSSSFISKIGFGVMIQSVLLRNAFRESRTQSPIYCFLFCLLLEEPLMFHKGELLSLAIKGKSRSWKNYTMPLTRCPNEVRRLLLLLRPLRPVKANLTSSSFFPSLVAHLRTPKEEEAAAKKCNAIKL